MQASMEWRLKALTDLWTGDANQSGKRLIPTGLLGSIRWWFEVLVRGFGGSACDPTLNGVRCPDKEGRHCVACELFGCTGWARKFRLMVMDQSEKVIQDQIKENQTFILRFVPLRPICGEEWCLLDATLRLIANYGAIGGKTVLKPSDEPNQQEGPHKDFGLVKILSGPSLNCERSMLEKYVSDTRWRKQSDDSAFAWASLQNFWCVKGRYLARQDSNRSSFNQVLGRPEAKRNSQTLNRWLAGGQQESKKVFSFKKPPRTFGFVKPRLVDFGDIKERLQGVWQNFDSDKEFLTGEQILQQLLRWEGAV